MLSDVFSISAHLMRRDKSCFIIRVSSSPYLHAWREENENSGSNMGQVERLMWLSVNGSTFADGETSRLVILSSFGGTMTIVDFLSPGTTPLELISFNFLYVCLAHV